MKKSKTKPPAKKAVKKPTSKTLAKKPATAAPKAEKIRPREMEMTEEKFRERFSSEIEAQAEALVSGYTNDNEEWGLALESAYDSVSYLRQNTIRTVNKITSLQWKPLAKTEAARLSGIAAEGVSLKDISATADDPDAYFLAEGQSVWSFTLKCGKNSLWICDESAAETIARCGKKDGLNMVKALELVPAGFVRDDEEHGEFVINLEEEAAKKYLLACGFSPSNIR